MNKKQAQSEQTRKKISDAARSLFVQKGYKATSIEDIVAATGSSKGNIYYHFKSKEGLFSYLLHEWDRDWLEKWQARLPSYATATAKIYGLAEQIVREDLNHPLTRAADEFFSNDEQKSEIEEKMNTMMQEHLLFNRQLIQEGVDGGEFSGEQIEQKALVLEGIIVGMSRVCRNQPLEQVLKHYQFAIDTFLHGIAAGPQQS
ncbi:TetR/AcrR family transcriptional regulator [Paenibacillus hunanensis]|uniref:TetR/AcrR family transcriptional regulator n=1 Tax=Paenibacillus hunanensis TaxID=539262 RepID=UPI002026825E|nr:TetR/AcrR family transcriptional regulator [Paenibacillus hunanensis]MCL9663561.1 TetR/AcrR family transcriptional regulator [Paenibacillus hunanensis]